MCAGTSLCLATKMDDKELFVVGAEFSELKFNGFWDWFVHVSDLSIHLKYQPSYLVSQFAFTVGGIATLIHAFIRGGRLPWLWLGIFLHGVVVECMSYFVPDIDNFWHSQTPIMFLGGRFPLHIMILYPVFLYHASVAVAKMRLPKWAEPFAVGLCVVLIDIPYDILSVNYLHWTWHDTDPNIYDRHYWVPWNSYYFHTTFAASFTFWFHMTRKWFCQSEGKWVSDKRWIRELVCTLIAGVLGTPGGILLFIPIYHPLHDIYKLHSEVTYFILFSVALLIIWSADRSKRTDDFDKTQTYKFHWSTWILIAHLVLHYGSFLTIPFVFKSENEISMGLKEPIGPCDQNSPVHTAFGMVLQKRKYLCPTDYDEGYFNWDCLPNKKPPSDGSIWYTACGTPLPNVAEMRVLMALLSLIAAVVFRNLHFKSSGDVVFNYKDKIVSGKSSKSATKKKVKEH